MCGSKRNKVWVSFSVIRADRQLDTSNASVMRIWLDRPSHEAWIEISAYSLQKGGQLEFDLATNLSNLPDFGALLAHFVPDLRVHSMLRFISLPSPTFCTPFNIHVKTLHTLLAMLVKLYAMVLESRATAWAEDRRCRAKGQAGFRKDFRTTDQLFIIRTILQQAKHSKRQLYCCFVDFKKAFDLVPRESLWQVLERRNVREGTFFTPIHVQTGQSMCAHQ